jgi:hypothetical protein
METFSTRGFEIKKNLLKKILNLRTTSELYSSTALSKQEVVATWILIDGLKVFEGTQHGFVGNVGIKTYIPSNLKNYVNESKDLDVAVKNIKTISKKYKVVEEALTDGVRYTHRGIEIVYSPFRFFKINIPQFQIGWIVYDTIDVFTPEVGIGPIPLKEEDFKKIEYIEYLPVFPLSLLISTHINPAAFTYERLKRGLLAAIYNPIKIDEIEQKLEESIEVTKKLGRGFQYREGFGKASRECYKVEKKIEKIISRNKIGKENIENARKICKLLEKLYERF